MVWDQAAGGLVERPTVVDDVATQRGPAKGHVFGASLMFQLGMRLAAMSPDLDFHRDNGVGMPRSRRFAS